MNIKNRTPDIQKVFDETWKANNYSTNGVSEQINNEKQRMNRVLYGNNNNNTNPIPKNINSIENQLENLQKTMNAVTNQHNRNNFR